MKTLKLDHELAELVRQGDKTSTWRLFDDKDISVGDDIELIDKVDPAEPETWEAIPAKVERVIEKPLGAVAVADFDGHELFASPEEMLATYQKYYGSEVTMDTPIKIIHFSLKD